MSTIHVEHAHSLPADEALRRAQELVGQLAERIKADIKWAGDTAEFKGTGFSGKARIAPSLISLDIDLSMLLRPLKGKVEARIAETLKTRFT